MYFIRRKTNISRNHFWYIGLTISLLLLSDDNSYLPGINRVESQLDAVSAVLSVVPVTSILTTAGLVGVNMAAMSRLLEMFGYDKSYLASGGAGTAAQPIGLQHNYAYNFPYVPGVNISVRGEHDFAGQIKPATGGVTPFPSDRKTYPALLLPGDYENHHKYRGVDIGKILSKATLVSEVIKQNQPLATNMHQQVSDANDQQNKATDIESESARSESSNDPSVRSQPTNIQSTSSPVKVSRSGHQGGSSSLGLPLINYPVDQESTMGSPLGKPGFGMPTTNVV